MEATQLLDVGAEQGASLYEEVRGGVPLAPPVPQEPPGPASVGWSGGLPARDAAEAKVAILLCTYFGQRFLADQLDSFAAQSHTNWQVWASDDGSTDATRDILTGYQAAWGASRLDIQAGPARGSAVNFLTLACNEGIAADYFAYSDQDDIWDADKLSRATAWLDAQPADVPALYCSRTQLVDAHNGAIGYSPLFTKPASFANALIQNLGAGNTMVFNRAARRLLQAAGKDIDVLAHDWWTYLAVTGCGGNVYYDTRPSLRYRQHEQNQVGMNAGWATRMVRIRTMLRGGNRHWNDRNIAALQKLRAFMTPENREILDRFAAARHQWFMPRLVSLARSVVYSQSTMGNLGVLVAGVLKRF